MPRRVTHSPTLDTHNAPRLLGTRYVYPRVGEWVTQRECVSTIMKGQPLHPYAVQCRYNVVNFPPDPDNRHHITRLCGRGMGCLLWFNLWCMTPATLQQHINNNSFDPLWLEINYNRLYRPICYHWNRLFGLADFSNICPDITCRVATVFVFARCVRA